MTALWYLSRASGTVTLLLLTAVLVLGTVTAGCMAPRRSALVLAVHRTLSLGMSVFLVGHIVTAVLEGFVDIGWLATLVPFTSNYETVWIGFGTLAVDLLIAVIGTSLLRHRLPEHLWRTVHWFAYAMWPFAIVHGFALGTANVAWLRDITIFCGVVGVVAAAARLWNISADSQLRGAVVLEEWR